MANQSFSLTTEFPAAPQQVFDAIASIPKWWTTDFEGSTDKVGDVFIIHHPGAHYSKQKLVEAVPGKKLVWLVTEGTLHWLKNDQHEWTGTRMIFELTGAGDKTRLNFIHDGLTPDRECYTLCSRGWTMIITERLLHYITTGKMF